MIKLTQTIRWLLCECVRPFCEVSAQRVTKTIYPSYTHQLITLDLMQRGNQQTGNFECFKLLNDAKGVFFYFLLDKL